MKELSGLVGSGTPCSNLAKHRLTVQDDTQKGARTLQAPLPIYVHQET
jgi:hypothetical protein